MVNEIQRSRGSGSPARGRVAGLTRDAAWLMTSSSAMAGGHLRTPGLDLTFALIPRRKS